MKRYFALSRTYHVILDIATPGFCTLLWLGTFPDTGVVLVGLITAFSGYTAIYALNDLVGLRLDRKKMKDQGIYYGYTVESTELRHPIAQKKLTIIEALIWICFWSLLAIIGAYWLNPLTIIIFLIAGICEIMYCLLFTVTYLRFFLSGIVKAAGSIAAIFAVDAHPDVTYLLLILIWLFLWEVGGQNIPADWNDVEEDKKVGAHTIPVVFNEKCIKKIVLTLNIFTVVMCNILGYIIPISLGYSYIFGSTLIGFILLILPALHLYIGSLQWTPSILFTRASYYPLALLVWLLISLYIL